MPSSALAALTPDITADFVREGWIPPGGQLRVGPPLELWTLSLGRPDLLRGLPLARAAVFTGTSLHMVFLQEEAGERPIGEVLTKARPGAPYITGQGVGPLAGWLHQAQQRRGPGEDPRRVLAVAAPQMLALWWPGAGELWLAHAREDIPPGMGWGKLTEEELLRLLLAAPLCSPSPG